VDPAEKKRQDEEAARKKAAEDEAARKKAAEEEEARKKAAEEEAARKKAAEEEAARKRAAEEEATRKAEEEAKRKVGLWKRSWAVKDWQFDVCHLALATTVNPSSGLVGITLAACNAIACHDGGLPHPFGCLPLGPCPSARLVLSQEPPWRCQASLSFWRCLSTASWLSG
jgi:hypothetical protein